MTSEISVFLGVNISGGGAYLGAVRGPDRILVEDEADRILPNESLELPLRLEDFRARLAQEMRRLRPTKIGVARTLMYKGWSMKSATSRFGFEAAAMLAAVQEDFECELVRQEDAAKSVGVRLTEAAEQLPDVLGIDRTRYWKDRSIAFMIARHLSEEES
jgi:hypothetical protein